MTSRRSKMNFEYETKNLSNLYCYDYVRQKKNLAEQKKLEKQKATNKPFNCIELMELNDREIKELTQVNSTENMALYNFSENSSDRRIGSDILLLDSKSNIDSGVPFEGSIQDKSSVEDDDSLNGVLGEDLMKQVYEGIESPKLSTKIVGKIPNYSCPFEAAQFLESSESEIENTATKIRRKREVFSKDEKRIAGCLLQCVYRKRKAVNNSGFPTTEGLVSLYAEGVTDKDYLLATHQAVHYCLTSAHRKYIVSPQSLSEHGKTCDIAFDTFDCVSDKIGEYCGQTL